MQWLLLRLYGDDDEFMRALRALRRRRSARTDRLAAWRLASSFGLDRLGPNLNSWVDPFTPDGLTRAGLDGDHPGLLAIVDWLAAPASLLRRLAAHGHPFPVSTGVNYSADHDYTVAIAVPFSARWDPMNEPRTVARDRLLKIGADREQLIPELDRAQRVARGRGLAWPDSRTEAEAEHLVMLFSRIRRRLSWGQLATGFDGDRDTIRHIVRDIATRTGVRL